MYDYADLFGADGPLATAIPGFATREEQIEMAEQVALALRARRAPALARRSRISCLPCSRAAA